MGRTLIQPEMINASPLTGFRNKIINGDFNVWQRGTSFSAAASSYYSADRWTTNASGGTLAVSQQSFTLGQTDVPGNPKYFMRVTISTGADYCGVLQKIEGIHELSGKTATVTAYLKGTNPGGGSVTVQLLQHFGSGGSPSSSVAIPLGTVVLTSSATKFQVVVDIPSISGKILGTDGNSRYELSFTQGSDTSTAAWELDTAHVSLVEGDASAEDDPFSPRHPAQEKALCERYWEKSYRLDLAPGVTNYAGSSALMVAKAGSIFNYGQVFFTTAKRIAPSITFYSPVTGASGQIHNATDAADVPAVTAGLSERSFQFRPSSATGIDLGDVLFAHWVANAEL